MPPGTVFSKYAPSYFDALEIKGESIGHADFAVQQIADWPEDVAHFCNFLITGPGTRIDTPPLTFEVRRDLDAVSKIPHNALEDARAMRLKYLEIMK